MVEILMTTDWRSILKIKTPNGEYLVVKDVERFKELLRTELDTVGLRTYGQIGYNRGRGRKRVDIPPSLAGVAEGESTPFNEAPRKSNVVVREKWQGERLIIIASARHPTRQDRLEYTITLMENDEGDFVYLTAFGPNLSLGGDDELNNETSLIIAIGEALEGELESVLEERPEPAHQQEEPPRQTGAEVRAEVEAANPGYIMIQGQMHNVETLKERAERKGISLRVLVQQMGGNLGDRSRY
jgi:hypothetical protein